MSTINLRGNNPRVLELGIDGFFGDLKTAREKQAIYPQIFQTETSDEAFELDQHYGNLTPALVKSEGAQAAFESNQQGISPKYLNLTYAKGSAVSIENLTDEKYNILDKIPGQLMDSVMEAKEIYIRIGSGG